MLQSSWLLSGTDNAAQRVLTQRDLEFQPVWLSSSSVLPHDSPDPTSLSKPYCFLMERESPNRTPELFLILLVRIQQTFKNVFNYAVLMPEK